MNYLFKIKVTKLQLKFSLITNQKNIIINDQNCYQNDMLLYMNYNELLMTDYPTLIKKKKKNLGLQMELLIKFN